MDPGWKPAIRPFIRRLLLIGLFDRTPRKVDGLVLLRTIWLSLVVAMFLYLFVLNFIVLDWTGDAGRYPIMVAVVGSLSLLWQRRIISTPLDGRDADTLRKSYQQMFFKGFAAAELPTLIGFFGVFVTKRIWVYLLGLAFGLVGMIAIAPSRRNLDQHQARLRHQGSPLSLVKALAQPDSPQGNNSA